MIGRLPRFIAAGLSMLGAGLAPSPGAAAETLNWLSEPALGELSGLAASGRVPNAFWAHNDSGHRAELFLVAATGELLDRVTLPAVAARDWEDIAAFTVQNQPWLAIADTGDNFALRKEVAILLLPEPLPRTTATPAVLPPAPRRIRLRFADGPRDVEALAVDVRAGQILLLEKRRPPAGLYAVELSGADQQVAQRIASLPEAWPEAPTPVETIGDRRYRGAITAMDLSADGRALALLSATHWMVYERDPGEAWSVSLQRAPACEARLPRHDPRLSRVLYEAIAWDRDQQQLWISGEQVPAPLLRVTTCRHAPG